MKVVILTGSLDALGRRVRERLGAAVPVIDPAAGAGDLKAALEAADVAVHLGPPLAAPWDEARGADELERVRGLLDAYGDAGLGHLVVVSSATVYGAWPNNPVPLTEDAPLRPNPGFALAVTSAEIERLLADWREGHPSTTVTILRPTVGVAEDAASWLARALRAAAGIRVEDTEPRGQYVHLEDLAAAIEVACRQRFDGVLNVAPDGWIPAEQLRALAGGGPRLWLPRALATRLAPAGIIPYVVHPWVIANDRLKATGWAPSHTNEEAYVAGHRPGPWATLSPQRRQEIMLAGAGTLLAGAATTAGLLIRRAARRRV